MWLFLLSFFSVPVCFPGLSAYSQRGPAVSRTQGEATDLSRGNSLAGCFPRAALGQPQPILSIPRPLALPGPEQTSHLTALLPGSGEMSVLEDVTEIHFVQSAEEWCLFFPVETGGILGWVHDQRSGKELGSPGMWVVLL